MLTSRCSGIPQVIGSASVGSVADVIYGLPKLSRCSDRVL